MSSKVGFFCQWTIENYSFCMKEKLSSPTFTVSLLYDSRWNLCLQVNNAGIVCMLKRNNDRGPSDLKLFYEISIISLDHKLVPKYASQVEEGFEMKSIGKEIVLMSYNDYEENFKNTFEKETLIVNCRLWKDFTPDTIKFFIRTPVKTHKRNLRGLPENIASLTCRQFFLRYSERDSSPYKVRLERGLLFKGIKFYLIQMQPYRSQHVKCKISVLDAEGKLLVSIYGEHDFQPTEQNCDPLQLTLCKDLNFLTNTNKKQCVLIELQLSGAGADGMEQINFGVGFDELLVPSKASDDQNTQSNTSTATSLTSKLLNFYNDGTLCDVVLKTDSSSFPVHKVILCAQSPVFTTMLETDLMEKQTGTIPLRNMSDDTVKKMIMFMYTDQVEGFDFEGAVNLYLASDQYDIVQLKQLCRDFLKTNLDNSNITDALVVADLHQDEDLKNACHDFIFEHDSEVIASDKWNQFMQDHLKLAAETTHLIYRRKLER